MDPQRRLLALSVTAAALGYFVDLFDIVIFGVVRVASLNDLGLTGQANTDWGITLLNLQMTGMLVGGFAWGIVGDRYGRRFALLATILVFSLANIANAFVQNVEQYAVMRFIAGFGLAGELGAGITLVTELLPRNRRGYGATVVAFLGLVGALTASYVGSWFDWRTAYLVGGGMGLVVLALRFAGLAESQMFQQQRRAPAAGPPADWRLLVTRMPVLLRFLAVTAVGIPIWYVSALFVTFAPEYGRALRLDAPLTVAEVLRWQAIGLALGSGFSGLASEWLRTRKRIVWGCYAVLVAGTVALMNLEAAAPYLALMFFIGLAQGYWTVFITLAAEQFGTNIRATVATSVPNLVRAATVPVTLSVKALAPAIGWIGGTLAVGGVVFALAFVSLAWLKETYGKDLDYAER